MIQSIAQALGCEQERVGLKATTTEKLGFIGRGEGISAQVVVLLTSDPK
jgi:2-C-methyl-D-erythritol 2,4-cyclodiphosphate synthase